jgi:hypothetical protein
MGEGEIIKDNIHYMKKIFVQQLTKDYAPKEKKVWKCIEKYL